MTVPIEFVWCLFSEHKEAHMCPSADSFPLQSKTTVSLGITFCTLPMARAVPTCWSSTLLPEASEVRWTCSWLRLCYSKC